MASASNSTTLYSNGGHAYTLTAYFNENSTSIDNNTSSITCKATIASTNSAWSSSYNSTLTIYWHDNRENYDRYVASINLSSLGTGASASASGTINVTHNDNGSLSGYAYAYFSKGSTTSYYAPNSGGVNNGWTALATIPRVSDISCTSPNVGDAATVTLTRKSSSFRDTVTYTIGSLTGTLATKTADTSIAFDTSAIASSIYTQMGSTNKKITGTMTVQTFNGNTSIGTKSTNFTLYAKESDCVPTVTATIVDTNSDTVALTGDNNKIVKGYSNARVTYTITTKNGATLTSKTINGVALDTSPHTINGVNTNVFSIVATDSRGYSTTLTITKTLIDYVPLSLNYNAFRPTPTGSEIKVNFTGNYYNGSFGSTNNSLALSWKYRIKGAENWTNGGNFTLNTHYKISGNTFYSGTGSSASDISLSNSLFPYNKVYEIGIFYEDQLLAYSTVKTVPKGQPVVNWDDDGFYMNVAGFLPSGNELLDYTVVDTW